MAKTNNAGEHLATLLQQIGPIGADIVGLSTVHHAVIANRIKSLELYPGQEMMLLSLAEKQPCSQNDLVKYLCVDHSTVTISLARMEKSGLIAKERSAEDKRVTLVTLTSKGMALADKTKLLLTQIEAQLKANLSDDDLRVFSRVTQTIMNNLSRR